MAHGPASGRLRLAAVNPVYKDQLVRLPDVQQRAEAEAALVWLAGRLRTCSRPAAVNPVYKDQLRDSRTRSNEPGAEAGSGWLAGWPSTLLGRLL
jgi:hypothetical protein